MTVTKKHLRCGWCPRKLLEREFGKHVERMHGDRLAHGEVCNAREIETVRAPKPRKDIPGQSFMFEAPKETRED